MNTRIQTLRLLPRRKIRALHSIALPPPIPLIGPIRPGAEPENIEVDRRFRDQPLQDPVDRLLEELRLGLRPGAGPDLPGYFRLLPAAVQLFGPFWVGGGGSLGGLVQA
jgi:hypothetical protein